MKLENEIYYVHTKYENDGCWTKNKYEFTNKKEFLKFVHGNPAIDRYGDNHIRSYYEHIEQAYIKGEIDIMSLYEIDLEQEEKEC